MKWYFINIFVFLFALPFVLGAVIPSLAANQTKQVLSTERNQTEKRILYHRVPILEKIGT